MWRQIVIVLLVVVSGSAFIPIPPDGAVNWLAPEACPEFCPMLYSPACGSNGHTFVNECYLKQAACAANNRDDTPLKLQYHGRCSEKLP